MNNLNTILTGINKIADDFCKDAHNDETVDGESIEAYLRDFVDKVSQYLASVGDFRKEE